MNVESIVADVKGRVEPIVADVKGRVEPLITKGQDVVFSGFEVLKSANGIFVDGVSSVYRTQLEAGKGLVGAAQSSFEKARTAGFKAVASNPVAYLPEGKDLVLKALSDSRTVVVKTGDELVKTVKAGVETLSAKIRGETVQAKAKTAAKATTKAVKKTATKARKTAAKAAA
jgi:hypothetical protein